MTTPIDKNALALGPVREAVLARIAELIDKTVSPRTPLEQVPGYRGEIAALRWLLAELDPKKEAIHE